MIITKLLTLETDGDFSVINISDLVRDFVSSTGVRDGSVKVFYKHTTGAVLIGEHESGIIADLHELFESLAPVKKSYKHHLRGVDLNGRAHILSALLTISVEIPIQDSEMLLGTYQEILVVDMQTGKVPRKVVVQVVGE